MLRSTRRRCWWIAGGLIALSLSFLVWSGGRQSQEIKRSGEIPTDGTLIQDPKIVFQKAFWRHPEESDKILHAERREWSTVDGVGRWQWFIEVMPGPGMQAWLASNPFGLARVENPGVIPGGGAPPWFSIYRPGREIFQKQGGGFTLFHSADGKRLFAMDSGYGFADAAVRTASSD